MFKRFHEKRNYKNLRSIDIVRIDGDNWRPGMLQRGFLVRWMADASDGFLMTYRKDFERKEDAIDFIKNELGIEDFEDNTSVYESRKTKRPLSRKRRKLESKNDNNKIEICLQNLGKYNEGDLVFEWVTLPVDDFKPILDRIGINDKYEEWFIVDYSAPFDIGEYDDIYELNEIAKTFEDFGDIEKEVFSALINDGYDFKKAVEKVEDGDFIFVEADNEQDFGYNYVDDFYGGIENVPRDVLEIHFDYDSFGYDTIINGSYKKIPSGYVSFY